MDSPNFLSQTVLDCANKECFVYIHATLMSSAWMFFAGLGIITARHYKPLLGRRGKTDNWFPIHVLLMIVTFLCTVAGFVIIFVGVEGLSPTSETLQKAHIATGIIATALCVINPFMAICRCAPDSPARPIFNYAHYSVGMGAHAFGIVTIAIGVSDPFFTSRVNSADWTRYLVYTYVAVHIFTMFCLELITCCTKRKNTGEAYSMVDSAVSLAPQPSSGTAGAKLKIWIYGGYFWVVLGLTLMTLIGIWNPRWINEIIVPQP